jgi:hypothetical protein
MNTNELGILERVLVRRYGQPELKYEDGMQKKIWREGTAFFSDLYYSTDWTRPPASDFRMHQPIYGASSGGTLVGDSLKVATPWSKKVYGIYNLHTFGERMEVQRAMELDPELAFFMAASNVQYYGHKCGRLFVYDAAFDELDDLGPIESALEEIIANWDAVTTSVLTNEGKD